MRFCVLGDIMPGGVYTGSQIIKSKGLQNYINNFDLRIATLESAIGSYPNYNKEKCEYGGQVCVWSHDSDLNKLKDLNINVVSLANNHTGDFGEEGLKHLLIKLDELGVSYIGAGENIEKASKPFVYREKDTTYAFIAVCQDSIDKLGYIDYATDNSWGVYKYDESCLTHIKTLKKEYDYVFVIVHWGLEHRWLPEKEVVEFSKEMIDAGADGIIGDHPHHIQPRTLYKGKFIYYSLGNFFFPEIYVNDQSNVFYPSEHEKSSLPTFNRFPIKRNFSMKYYWSYYGRLGMIADISIENGKVCSEYKLSLLNNDTIHISHNIKIRIYLRLLEKIIKKEKNIPIVNKILAKIEYIYFYKIKSIFNKKYQFYQYIKTLE